MNIIYFNYVILGHTNFPNNALSIFNTIKKYISNPETVLRQLSFDVKDGELVIK